MAWNRTNTNKSTDNQVRVRKISNRRIQYFFGAVAFISVASIVVWRLVAQKNIDDDPKQQKTARLITDNGAHVAKSKPLEEPTVEERKVDRYWERDTTNGLTAAQIRKWKFVRQPKPAFTNNFMFTRKKEKFEIFDTYAENMLAFLLTIEPGKQVFGTPRYSKDIEQEFLKSCETPIIITADDDDYTRDLKRAMIDAKIEIRNRMADGESFVSIIDETRKEAMRLGQIKQSVIQDVRNLVSENAQSEEDIDSFYEAANKILEQNGIAPIKAGRFYKMSVMRKLKAKQGERQ